MKRAERFYRDFTDTARWKSFRVKVDTSDLYIRADKDLSAVAEKILRALRDRLWEQIDRQGEFHTALAPVGRLDGSPEIVIMMYNASERAGVGPMAAVAGAVAELTGRALAPQCREIIVENGGDIFMHTVAERRVAVFAGGSPLSGRVALRIKPAEMPLGICTSSATVGPSLSFGSADAACVLSASAALADAAASQIGNQVKTGGDIKKALRIGADIPGVKGIVIIIGKKMGAWGMVEFCA